MQGKLSVTFHLVSLVIVGLVAYLIFSSPALEPEKGTKILDVLPSELSHMALVAERKRVDIAPREGGGFTLTVSVDNKNPGEVLELDEIIKDTPDKKAGSKKDEKPGVKTVGADVKAYRASNIFEERLDKVLPLMVVRNLGSVTPEQLKKFKLDDPKRTLVVEAKDQKVSYVVGAKTFGGATTYIQRRSDGPVYLLSSQLMQYIDIKMGAYMERRLVEFEKDDVTFITLEKNGRKQKLRKRGQGRFAKWIPADNTESKNAIFDNWVNSVFRTPVEDYVYDESLLPKLTEEVKIVFKKNDQVSDTLELASYKPEEAKSKATYYARSVFLGQWVILKSSDAERMLSELSSVLEGG